VREKALLREIGIVKKLILKWILDKQGYCQYRVHLIR